MEPEKDVVHQENQSNTEDRIRTLEQRVEQQDDEITLLKSSLADVLRRLKDLEGGPHLGSLRKPSPMKNHFQPLPSRPIVDNSGTPKPRVRPPSPSPNMHKRSPSTRDEAGKTNGQSPTTAELRRTGSIEGINRDSKRSSFRARKPSGGGNHKQISYNEDDGSVRMHLRGRPVVMYKPTSIDSYNVSAPSQAPDNKLKLEWVYGYRGKDCRSNLYFLPTGEIVYFVAAVVVMYDPKDGYQRHYLGHNDDVKCLAIHPDKLKIATGQVSGLELDGRPRLPQVHIWDAVSLTTLHVLTSFERAVACLSFSKTDGGTLLCAIDESNDHVMSVWNWAKESKVAEVKSSKDPVLACEFNPIHEGTIVTCGKSHVNFWTVEGSQLTKKQGLFEKHSKPKYLLCLSFTATGDVLTGDSNGNIQLWAKGATRKISRVLEGAHEGAVFSICATRDNGIITGGKDGYIKKWNDRFALTQQTHVGEQAGSVRTISCDKQGLMLIGTKKNCILSGSFDSSLDLLVHGHTDELWGLATHPSETQFLTGAADKQLILWNSATHTPVWVKAMDDGIQSADFHPTNPNVIAVGMVTGRWLLLDAGSLELLVVHTDGNEQHDVVKFSPDGNLLAIGSHDNNIYLYNVSDDGKKVTRHGKCSGHSSYITHFDWSADSQYLQSNSGDYELLYWDVAACRQMTAASQLRDVEWYRQSCTLGFNVLGVWPEGADGTDVNSVCRSNNGKLLASGDDFGKVHLYKYPTVQPRSASHAYNGHSSHVTSVQFMRDDDHIISTGGQDCSVMQWRVV